MRNVFSCSLLSRAALPVSRRLALLALVLAPASVFATGFHRQAAPVPPIVGAVAPDFTWTALDSSKVTLSKLTAQGPVVLILLRGFPGYQCPFCTAQVAELRGKARQFSAAKAQVVLVYPGPADALKQHASEFVAGKEMPKNFRLVLDPDFAFTNRYGLRWDARGETSYPSTFVIGHDGKVIFAKISHGHGGRASADEILAALLPKTSAAP
jgi:peroxiredoxin Q/BCP